MREDVMKKKFASIRFIACLLGVLATLTLPGIVMAKNLPHGRFHGEMETNPIRFGLQGQDTFLKAQFLASAARLQGGIAAAISSLLSIIFLLSKSLSFQRQADGAAQALKIYTLPPQALSPGLAAHLCSSSNPALATFFDLAQRGFLRVEEKEHRWGQSVFEIVRQPIIEAPQPHEEAFMDALFRFKKTDCVPLSRLGQLAYSKTYQKALQDELTLRGWHSLERTDKREQFAFLAGSLMVIGLLIFAVGIGIGWRYAFGAILMGSGGGFLLAGFAGLILSLSLSTFSDEGVHQAIQWQAFAAHLREMMQDEKQQLNAVLFDRYLPLAAGFGFLDQWVSHFFKQSQVTIPDWFSNVHSADQESAKDAFAAMVLALTATAASSVPVTFEEGGSSETVLSGIQQ